MRRRHGNPPPGFAAGRQIAPALNTSALNANVSGSDDRPVEAGPRSA